VTNPITTTKGTQDDTTRKLSLFKAVDLNALDKEMGKYDKWIKFREKFPNIEKISNIDELKLFVDTIVTFEDGSSYDPDKFYKPGTYTVDERFEKVLLVLQDPVVRKYYFQGETDQDLDEQN